MSGLSDTGKDVGASRKQNKDKRTNRKNKRQRDN